MHDHAAMPTFLFFLRSLGRFGLIYTGVGLRHAGFGLGQAGMWSEVCRVGPGLLRIDFDLRQAGFWSRHALLVLSFHKLMRLA